MRIAALDLGSNSFHVVVVEAQGPSSFETLAEDKEMLRLGDAVAASGRIGPDLAQRAVDAVSRFARTWQALGAVEVVARATSAIREAEDGGDLVDRLEDETGVEIEVISGAEEARLIYEAVRASVLIKPSPALVIDLGGGSLELMVGDQAGLWWSDSRPLGVGRLTACCVRSDPPSAQDLECLAGAIRAGLDPATAAIEAHAPRLLVGTSGTLLALARAATAMAGEPVPAGMNQLKVGRAGLGALFSELLQRTAGEREKLAGIEARRAETVVAGAAVLAEVVERFGFDELMVSEWAMREGMVLDAVGHHPPAELSADPRAVRRAAVASLCARFSCQSDHCEYVDATAMTLFDATRDLHGLGEEDRELLHYAALLHDVGEAISADGHDRHGAYMVESSGLRGFAPVELSALASVVRFHRRGTPKPSAYAPFGRLSRSLRERVAMMAALLRVADALDYGHCQALDVHEVVAGPVTVVISAVGRGGATEDGMLELWALRRKRSLLEQLAGRRVELHLSPSSGPGGVTAPGPGGEAVPAS